MKLKPNLITPEFNRNMNNIIIEQLQIVKIQATQYPNVKFILKKLLSYYDPLCVIKVIFII